MKKIMLISFLVGFAGFAAVAQTSRTTPPKFKNMSHTQTQADHEKMIAEKNRIEADNKTAKTASTAVREDRSNNSN